MANLKYNEETKIVTFRVPESKVKVFREKVNAILKSFKPTESNNFSDIIKSKKEIDKIISTQIGVPEKLLIKKEIPTTEKKCDCYLDSNGFLRRGKIKCTKSKKEHKF